MFFSFPLANLLKVCQDDKTMRKRLLVIKSSGGLRALEQLTWKPVSHRGLKRLLKAGHHLDEYYESIVDEFGAEARARLERWLLKPRSKSRG